jgi:hypothetical protein
VIERKTLTPKQCLFPFEFNDISFNGCTHKFHPENQAWCPTKIPEDGKYDHWGYCSEKCPLDLNGTS